MGRKKRNFRGMNLASGQRRRQLLEEQYIRRGRPGVPKYILNRKAKECKQQGCGPSELVSRNLGNLGNYEAKDLTHMKNSRVPEKDGVSDNVKGASISNSKSSSFGPSQAPKSVQHQNLRCEALETVKSEMELENVCLEPSREVDSAFSLIQKLKQEYSESCHAKTTAKQNKPQALYAHRNDKNGNNDLDSEELAFSSSHCNQGITAKDSAIDSDIVMDMEVEEDGKTRQQRPETKVIPVAGLTSAFTIEIIADILEKPVEELEANLWEEKIKTEFDDVIFKKLIQLTPTKRRYKCVKCKAQIKGKVKDVESHMKEFHDSDLVFGCFFCPLARVTPRGFSAHERAHVHYNPTLSCAICDSVYKKLLDVNIRELHLKCHPPLDEIATYTPKRQIIDAQRCVLCVANHRKNHLSDHSRRSYFIRHLLIHHVNITAMCEICGVVMNYWKLERHLRTCKQSRLVGLQGPSKCGDCGFVVFGKRGPESHDCKGKYDCSVCDAKFVNNRSLQRHMKNLHSRFRNHVCHICGKGFQMPFNLQDHINTHTGEKPFQCLACGTRHASRPALAAHLRSWHDVTIREMKEKYKNCPVPEEPTEDIELPRAREKGVENKEEKINLYTGRKIGRPRMKKASGSGEARSNHGLRTTDLEPIHAKGKTVKRSRKKERSSDSEDDSDFSVSEMVNSDEEKKKVAKNRIPLSSNFLSDDSEQGKEEVTKKRRRLSSDFSGDDSEEKGSHISCNFSDSDTGKSSCE